MVLHFMVYGLEDMEPSLMVLHILFRQQEKLYMETAKAVALINGRRYCVPDDVKALRYSVLRHRIMLTFAAVADDIKVEQIIDAIVGAVKTP